MQKSLLVIQKAFLQAFQPINKGAHELSYWEHRKADEKVLRNAHYEYFYTTHFGLDENFYKGKKIIDIGCGPRGSLEWADMTAERVGLDPLANSYLKLGADKHKMQYVATGVEKIPYPDRYFDVVCSFNSLDHVDNLDRAIDEIIRIIAPGGLLLLLTELNHEPTPTEPISFSWDILDKFVPKLQLVEEKRYEQTAKGMYDSIRADIPYNYGDPSKRYGILSAKFTKPMS